jgi:hypothetical protein
MCQQLHNISTAQIYESRANSIKARKGCSTQERRSFSI